MKVRIQSVNFSADQKLITFIEKRLTKLEQFYDRIVDSEVYLKVDNNHTKQNKITEIRLNIPGNDLIVKKQCKSFEEATDLSAEALRRQLRKHKEKSKALAS
ncbi:MAG: ribosome-associated translation inhibitor RaiA [Owenweeksia sp.]